MPVIPETGRKDELTGISLTGFESVPLTIGDITEDKPIVDKDTGISLEGFETEQRSLLGATGEWNEVEKQIPETEEDVKRKSRNSLSLAATLDISPSIAYELHDELTEQLRIKDADLGEKALGSLKAGMGDVYTTVGRTLQWAGSKEVYKDYLEYGEKLRLAYIPPEDPSEFTWRKMIDPEWYATTITRSVPFMLSLLPAAVIGTYAGVGTATAVGLGTAGKVILAAIGGATLSRTVESALEAGGAYEESLNRGDSEEEADKAAKYVFKGNMALIGVDVAQFATAFTPLRFLGKAASKTMIRRMLAVGLKVSAIGTTEAGEEIIQDIIKRKALGQEVVFDPQMKESGAVGFVLGAGAGGAGSVWATTTGRIKGTMSDDMLSQYEEAKSAEIAMGATPEEADLRALDIVAETPEGKEHIENTIQKLKDIAEDKEPEIITTENQESDIEGFEKEEEETISEEDLDALIADEKTFEEAIPKEKKIRLEAGEDIALRTVIKQAIQNAKTGTKEAKAIARTELREILFQAKIKAELKGEKRGIKEGTQITKKELIAHFKDSQAEMKQTRDLLVTYINENLPSNLRGKFLSAVAQNFTRKRLVSIYGRVGRLADEQAHKDKVAEFKELKKLKGDISVDYQKKVNEVLVDIDTKKITPRTLKKLENLRDFIEREGVPSGISPKLLKDLKGLEKKNVNDMTTVELQNLINTANHLREMGKLKLQLKYKYNERLRNIAQAKLKKSTVNIDPKKESTWTKGAKQFYIETLNPLRVAEMLDGYKSGENQKLIKRLVLKETSALLQTKTVIDTALQEIIDLGMETLTPEQEVKIMINIRLQEGAFDQVQTLMDRNDYTEVPELTEQESKVIGIIRKHTTQHEAQIIATYEEIENKIFPKLPVYILPIKYEREFNYLPSEAIVPTKHRTTQTAKGFTYQRQKGVKKIPRTDILGIFEQAINEQQWYINMQPELEDIKYLVKTKEYAEQAGKMGGSFWKDHLDIVSRRGWSATASQSNMTMLLREARHNLTQAILGYKLSSILMQPFAVFDAMAYMQAKFGSRAALEVFKEFSKAWINPKQAHEFIDVSPALQMRKAGEVAIAETLERIGRSKGAWKSFIRGGLSLLQKADVITAAGVEKGILKVLEKHGIENAKEEAEILMMMVSSSSEVNMRPHILAKGELSRAFFTFQTFFLNRWGIMAHDLIVSGVIKNPDWGKKVAALIGLGIFLAGSIAEDEAREFVYEMTTKRELPETSILETVALSVPKNIPFFGNMIEAVVEGRGSTEIPLQRTVTNLFKGPYKALTAKEQDAMIRGIIQSSEAVITLRFGVPATAQVADILEGIFVPPKKKGKRSVKKRKKK